MSDSSLIPERQLVFSPALAATIGLEEAILLQHLGELLQHRSTTPRDGFNWLRIDRDWLVGALPFWNTIDLYRILKSLAEKGVILLDSPPLHETTELVFAINESVRQAEAVTPPLAPSLRGGASLLSPNWRPGTDLIQLLSLHHAIPEQFALDQLEDFVGYWCERGEVCHAWENRFRQHVLSRWRHQQQHAEEQRLRPPDGPIQSDWYPSEDALEILERNEVSRAFIDDAVPEFVLYWRERGESVKTLNHKFINHIRRQWDRYTSALVHDTEPQRIATDWQPRPDVYDILHMSHIDPEFARSMLLEFVLYWRDTNQLHSSWNTKFLQHVKYKWARRHQLNSPRDSDNAGQQRSNKTGSTRTRSLEDDLADRSWAH